MKPLLAYNKVVLPKDITYPCLASAKSDGIRGLLNKHVYSRSEKEIPNRFVQTELAGLSGFDGELILRDKSKDFNDQQSAFMTFTGKPDFEFLVFDKWDSDKPFRARLKELEELKDLHPRIKIVPHVLIKDAKEMVQFYNDCLAQGYEGVIARKPTGKYKNGRSTLNEGLSLKLKPAHDEEAFVMAMAELKDVNGIPQNTMGSLYVKLASGVAFNVGTGEGLTAERRKHYWNNKADYIGKTVTVRYYEKSRYGVPRQPTWRGFRHEKDQS